MIIEGLRHAYRDLLFHSEERNTYLRYFLLVIGALATGFGNAILTGEYLFAIAASLLSSAVSLLFLLMDVQHVARIKVALKAVTKLRATFAQELEVPELLLTGRTPAWFRRLVRRSGITPLRLLFIFGLILSLGSTYVGIEGFNAKSCLSERALSKYVVLNAWDTAFCRVSEQSRQGSTGASFSSACNGKYSDRKNHRLAAGKISHRTLPICLNCGRMIVFGHPGNTRGKMVRSILGAVLGVVVWFAVVIGVSLILREGCAGAVRRDERACDRPRALGSGWRSASSPR